MKKRNLWRFAFYTMISFIIHCKNTSNNRNNKILQKQLRQITLSITHHWLTLQFTSRSITRCEDFSQIYMGFIIQQQIIISQCIQFKRINIILINQTPNFTSSTRNLLTFRHKILSFWSNISSKTQKSSPKMRF